MEKNKPATAAALAGGAVLGGNIARHNIRSYLQERKERGGVISSIAEAKKRLQPGDVIMVRSKQQPEWATHSAKKLLGDTPLQKYRAFRRLHKHLPELHEADFIRLAEGSPLHHSAIYAGGGKVIHAKEEGIGVVKEPLQEVIGEKGDEAKIYRMKASPVEKQKAVRYAHKAVGTPYTERKKLVPAAVKDILFGAGKPTTGRQCKGHACSTLVAEAYPKQFKRHLQPPVEALHQGKMEYVGKVMGGAGKLGLGERLSPYVIAPALRSLRYAVPAAGLAYATSKVLGKKRTPV